MTFYCTNCWAVVPESAGICPNCGFDIAAAQARVDFVDKLIAARHHPEPTTPIRAAWILGGRGESKAVDSLIELFQESREPFIAEGAVEALGKIGGDRARATLISASTHPSPRVRHKAEQALMVTEGNRPN